jgi:hypothetical protein
MSNHPDPKGPRGPQLPRPSAVPEPSDEAEAAAFSLSAEDEALLARAREVHHRTSVPEPIRLRLLARTLEEASPRAPIAAVPARPLVPVPQRGARTAWLGGALALGVFSLLVSRFLARSHEPGADVAQEAVTGGGAQLFDAPIFRAPAREAAAGELSMLGPNLLLRSPFSAQDGSWQVRRWDDLKKPPGEPARVERDGEALCVPLDGGQRVIGGWPWQAETNPPGQPAPAPVKLSAGRAYRLVLRAWARDPLPAQVLIAVGHAGVPFSAAGAARVPVSEEPQGFVVDFVAPGDDPSVGVAFLATADADADPTRVCISDVALGERLGR